MVLVKLQDIEIEIPILVTTGCSKTVLNSAIIPKNIIHKQVEFQRQNKWMIIYIHILR